MCNSQLTLTFERRHSPGQHYHSSHCSVCVHTRLIHSTALMWEGEELTGVVGRKLVRAGPGGLW